MASVEVDPDTRRGVVVAAPGARLTAADLNDALRQSPYRVAGLRLRD